MMDIGPKHVGVVIRDPNGELGKEISAALKQKIPVVLQSMTNINMPTKTYGAEADQFLSDLYFDFNALTTHEKILALKVTLNQSESNYYAEGKEVTEEMILGCLEYEYLERHQKIDLTLV